MKRPGITNAIIALFAILCFSHLAHAQWGQNGNDIHNTNTGNVGIGTGTTNTTARLSLNSVSDGFIGFSIQDNETPSLFESLTPEWGGSLTINMSNGQGEFDFVNRWLGYPESVRGFRFYQQTGIGTFSDLMTIQGSTGKCRDRNLIP